VPDRRTVVFGASLNTSPVVEHPPVVHEAMGTKARLLSEPSLPVAPLQATPVHDTSAALHV
jgi:hypothetical protein